LKGGTYYLSGIGVSSGALLFIMVLEAWIKTPPTAKVTKIFTRTAIGGIVLAILLPIVAGSFIESYLLDNEYKICESLFITAFLVDFIVIFYIV